MEPKDIVAIGLLLIVGSFVVSLLGSGLLVPVGILITLVGVGLYGFKQYHKRRMETGQSRK